jgi:hypothetical protein
MKQQQCYLNDHEARGVRFGLACTFMRQPKTSQGPRVQCSWGSLDACDGISQGDWGQRLAERTRCLPYLDITPCFHFFAPSYKKHTPPAAGTKYLSVVPAPSCSICPATNAYAGEPYALLNIELFPKNQLVRRLLHRPRRWQPAEHVRPTLRRQRRIELQRAESHCYWISRSAALLDVIVNSSTSPARSPSQLCNSRARNSELPTAVTADPLHTAPHLVFKECNEAFEGIIVVALGTHDAYSLELGVVVDHHEHVYARIAPSGLHTRNGPHRYACSRSSTSVLTP